MGPINGDFYFASEPTSAGASDVALRRPEQAVPAAAPTRFKSLRLEFAELTSELRSQYKVKSNLKGVLVTGIDSSIDPSNHWTPGDVIVEVQGEPVSNPAEMQRRLEQIRSLGKKTALLFVKTNDGETRFVALKLQ